MREILFRGKRVDNGEWTYGYYCPKPYSHFPCEATIFPSETIDRDWHGERVDPDTVGRFTGLTDRNDVKIFEGDIVRWHDNTELSVGGQIAEVCFGKYRDADSVFDDIFPLGFYIRFSDKNCVTISWLDEYKNYFDIIGSIHDNPELLEVSGNE
nr:MAG TPA: YopX protein [Caudoviricetes sp.]